MLPDPDEPDVNVIEPVVAEYVEAFFGEQSPLKEAARFGGRVYEHRPQQQKMAMAIADAYEKNKDVCIEAPTGIGKTFAYLIPTLFASREWKQPAVVSTHTISLQEQLIKNDLPLLSKLLPFDISFTIGKGRSNYVCLRRLAAAAGESMVYLPSDELMPELEKIKQWATNTKDGSLSELDFRPTRDLWETVCCEYGNCLKNKCEYFEQCFLMRARARMFKSDIIVVNHALFFADMGMRTSSQSEEGGILPNYAAAVFDEGHCIEDTASEHLGLHVTSFAVLKMLNRIYNPQHDRGIIAKAGYEDAKKTVAKAARNIGVFFHDLRDWVENQNKSILRYTTPGHIPDMTAQSLDEVCNVLRRLGANADEAGDEERSREFASLLEQAWGYRQAIHTILNMTLDNHVYWFAAIGKQSIGLNCVPLQIAPLLQDAVFDDAFRTIVTSATLAVNGKMDYFRERIGAKNAEELVLSSPYDFVTQVQLYLPNNMPVPNQTEQFIPAACEKIRSLLALTHGKAFVLFTSYKMLKECAEAVAPFCEENDIRLLVHGQDLNRTQMLEVFKTDTHSVIFGTASFWTGVDVPGEALSNVIIVRLPFSVPDHPVIAARHEWLERNGKNAFVHYSLPEAVLKFRQGVGRLIRNSTDTGIIAVLDPRIRTARYGKSFLKSIPECPIVEF